MLHGFALRGTGAEKSGEWMMRRVRNPRYAPEFLERKLSPSSYVTGAVAAQVAPAQGSDGTVQGGTPVAAMDDPGSGSDPSPTPTAPGGPTDTTGSGSGAGAYGSSASQGGGSSSAANNAAVTGSGASAPGGIYVSSGALALSNGS
jgi:hypothetical protein